MAKLVCRFCNTVTPSVVISRLLLALFLACMVQIAGVAAAGNTATVWESTGLIRVDGNLAEWDRSSPIVLDNYNQLIRDLDFWEGLSDFSANVYLMCDESNLYVGAEVTDDIPFVTVNRRVDEVDSMVLYFSTNPGADPNRESYESTDFMVALAMVPGYFDTCIDRWMVEDKKGIDSDGIWGGEQVLDGYECAVREFGGGYTYTFEAKIPFSNFYNEWLPEFSPMRGTKIGFDVQMSDLDFTCPGWPIPQMAWVGTNEIMESPQGWATLKFDSKEEK